MTPIPIYQAESLTGLIRAQAKNERNAGLFFDRYLAEYNTGEKQEDKKAAALNEMCSMMKLNRIGELLASTHDRLNRLVESLGGKSFDLSASWNLATGTGQPHPFETGFRWDYNLGVPVLPGSGQKGMMGAWLRYFKKDESLADRWLGTKDTAGSCTFFDAYPVSRPNLVVDTVTVHFKEYYEGKEKNPADYFDPIPIPFLAIAPKTEFRFRIAPRNGSDVDLGMVEAEFRDGTRTIGFGAKTAVGYGRLG